MTTAGKLKRVLPLPSDALRDSKSVISVSEKAYAIPCQPEEKYQQSVSLALSFQKCFTYLYYDCGRFSCSFPARSFDIRTRGIRERSAALAFVADFDWPDATLSRDRDLLHSFGSLDLVREHHSAIHRAAGLNPEIVYQWLSNDPRLSLLLTMATRGGGRSILTRTLCLFVMPDLSAHYSSDCFRSTDTMLTRCGRQERVFFSASVTSLPIL